MKKIVNRVFVIIILAVLTIGLLKTTFLPKSINTYENRYANKISPFSISSYLKSSYQTHVENALMDQISFAEYSKKEYNYANNKLLFQFMPYVFKACPNKYVSFMSLHVFGGDYLTYYTDNLSEITGNLNSKIDNLNQAIAKTPNAQFYLYYIEKDTDINFETGKKVCAFEYIKNRIHLPDKQMAKFSVDSFDQFKKYFYKTDHHWKYTGSYLAYTKIMAMLGQTDCLKPVETVALPYTFSGSKAASIGASNIFSEQFTAYRFNYPPMDISINGTPAADYGKQKEYFAGTPKTISYGDFYGGDDGEIIFDAHAPEKDNILVVGESYDNAVLKLIASHYNRTYSIDLRYYAAENGKSFNFSQYIASHNIKKVLLIGNIDYYTMKEFMLKG